MGWIMRTSDGASHSEDVITFMRPCPGMSKLLEGLEATTIPMWGS